MIPLTSGPLQAYNAGKPADKQLEYWMIEKPEELPKWDKINILFMDFETTSFDRDEKAFFPYRGHRIAGVSVRADLDMKIYYIPVRHTAFEGNISVPDFQVWLKQTLEQVQQAWVNSNVLFDAHFAEADEAYLSLVASLIDTLVLSKLHYSDRFSYDLKDMADEWPGIKLNENIKVKAFLKSIKSKNYGDCPPYIMGPYACDDILGNSALFFWLCEKHPADVDRIRQIEINLTSVLFDMEVVGLPVDVHELKREQRSVLKNLIRLSTELEELIGYDMNPKSHQDVSDLLINKYGMPVLAWQKDYDPEEEGSEDRDALEGSTFDKKALALYKSHPIVKADEKKKRVLEIITEYRKDYQYMSLFVVSYLEHQCNGRLHPSFNQVVRTGRMSCRRPNAQQLNKRAKKLIHPLPGYAFLSCDYSQVEFRLIVHYGDDKDAIQAYRENPLTDFHQWVAELCGVARKQAKNLNFAMGYGAGKAKVLSMLASDPMIIDAIGNEIAEEIKAGRIKSITEIGKISISDVTPRQQGLLLPAPEMDGDDLLTVVQNDLAGRAPEPIKVDLNEEYTRRCLERAQEIYETYHERLPCIKRITRHAANIVRTRGYVYTAYGRRRHLPDRASYRAFNTVVQGTAADVMKDRLVAVSPRFNQKIRDWDIHLVCCVHDEALFMGPIETLRDKSVRKYIVDTLQDTAVKFKIPILTSCGFGVESWAEANGDEIWLDDGLNYLAGPCEYDGRPDLISKALEDPESRKKLKLKSGKALPLLLNAMN